MGGEDRGADPERQHEEGFSSLAAHYSHWEDFKVRVWELDHNHRLWDRFPPSEIDYRQQIAQMWE